MKSESQSKWIMQFTKLMIIIFILSFSVNIGANTTDPCTVYGTVKDENGLAVTGAVITVENLNTTEMNSIGNDTITGNPIPIAIDSNGVYTFELINLKNGYRTGDEIIVTAEKNGITGSNSIIINDGSWSAKSDITLGMVETQKKEQWYDSFSNPWILLFIMIMLNAVILTVLLLKRKKGPKQKDESNKNVLIGNLEKKEVIEGKYNKQIVENESIAYECPECTEHIKAEDIKCPTCGVQFAES